GDRCATGPRPRRAHPRGLYAGYDPVEAGIRRHARLRPDLRQPGFRQVRRVLWRDRAPAVGCERDEFGAVISLRGRRGPRRGRAHRLFGEQAGTHRRARTAVRSSARWGWAGTAVLTPP